MINQWLDALSNVIADSMWLAPFFALVAGILTSATPCSLSSIPLIIGYVGGTDRKEPKRAFKLSVIFAVGMAITFTALGVIASLAGKLVGNSSRWWYLVLGGLMVLMALQTWGVLQIIPSTFLISKNRRKGYIGAFIAGILGGVFSSPCATPVLVVLLGIVAQRGNLIWGIILLLLYSIGHSILVLVAGTSVGFVRKITADSRYGIFSKMLNALFGMVILLIALYMFYLGF